MITYIKNRKGFTLLEVVTVIAIGVVLGGVTLVMLFGRKSVTELNDTARKMASVLREAQSRSVSQVDQIGWGVRFDNGASPNFAIFSGSPASPSMLPSIPLPKQVSYLIPTAWDGNPGTGISDVTFAQITGIPLVSGDNIVKISLAGSTTESSTISVYTTGAIAYNLLDCSITRGCVSTTIIIPPGEGSGNQGQNQGQGQGNGQNPAPMQPKKK